MRQRSRRVHGFKTAAAAVRVCVGVSETAAHRRFSRVCSTRTRASDGLSASAERVLSRSSSSTTAEHLGSAGQDASVVPNAIG
jgi:hypothetical protein